MDLEKLMLHLCILVLGWSSYIIDASINLARGKPVSQDSTDFYGPAENAVDGRYDPWHSDYSSCTHSADTGKVHYWTVDLKAKFRIGQVKIWNRKDLCCYERLSGLTLYISFNVVKNGSFDLVGAKKCGVYDGPPGQEVNYIEMSCGGKIGRYVTIVKKGGILTLCEVEVFKEENSEAPTGIEGLNLPNLRQEVTQGVYKVKLIDVVYSGIVMPISEKAEAILIDTDSHYAMISVSTLGKGRILASGGTFFNQSFAKKEPFWRNVMKWLSYGAEPSFVRPADGFERSDFEIPGKIILFDGYGKYSTKMSTMIKDLIISGKASIIYELHPGRKREYTKANQDLMFFEAGICFLSRYATWKGKKDWDITNLQPVDRMSLVNRMRWYRTLRGFPFHKTVKVTLALISELPPEIFKLVKEELFKFVEYSVAKAEALDLSRENPTRSKEEIDFLATLGELLMSPLLVDSGIKAPNVHIFPGSVPDSAPRVVMDLEIKASVLNEMHPTGLYLPPGGTLSVEPLSEGAYYWKVRIGCHTDDLEGKEELFRFPKITNKMKLGEKKIYHGFGGVVIVTNERMANISIKLRFKGAVKSPFFNLRDERNMAEWDTERRFAPGPWTEIAGDAMVYCVPTKGVKNYSSAQLTNVMRNYVDKFVKEDHHLCGSDWRTTRRERFSLDIQIRVGYGHAGYPIVASLDLLPYLIDAQYLSCESKKKCSWGFFHLIGQMVGHNFRASMAWKFKGSSAVVNNIFVLFNLHQMGRPLYKPVYQFEDKSTGHIKYLQNPNFKTWQKSPGISLIIYAQFAHHFGWGFYKQVFRTYLKADEKRWDFTDAEKIDKWIVTTSQVRGYNLIPTFDFWGFPISENVKSQLKNLTNYLPKDSVTQQVQYRVDYIVRKYRNVVRNIPKMDDPYLDELKRFNKMRENDVIEL